jgi:Domain of unknown function (DUF2357)
MEGGSAQVAGDGSQQDRRVMAETDGHRDRLAVLEQLMAQTLRLRATGRQTIAWPSPEPAFAVAATYFVLDLDRQGGVEWFIVHTLSRLVPQLLHSTEQQSVMYRGQVRGRILWPATFKARYTDDYDPSRFVCYEVRQRYDTPENQLLKYMIGQLTACLTAIPEAIRHGMCYLPADEQRVSIDTATRVGRMETTLHNLQRNVRWREITMPPCITEAHLMKAERALTADYTVVAHMYRRYYQIVLRPSWVSVYQIGQRVLPLPARPGSAKDAWIALGAAILGI